VSKPKYWTLSDIARQLGISRERTRQLWDKGHGWNHDAEDLAGRPLFLKCPEMPELAKPGRPRIGEPALKSPPKKRQKQ